MKRQESMNEYKPQIWTTTSKGRRKFNMLVTGESEIALNHTVVNRT